MTNTETADVEKTAAQVHALALAGSELVRLTVNTRQAARAVPAIVERLADIGCSVPLIGDFHYNGHQLLTEIPECAQALSKYRINPGNVGKGTAHEDHFATICRIAAENAKPVRIGVNAGSLDPELVDHAMRENVTRGLGKTSEEVLNDCMIVSALRSTEAALMHGLTENQIVISCKTSVPRLLIDLYRALARQTRQPLHLGLTEAGMGTKGLVWSTVPVAILLDEGIGDTIRISLTPAPGADRCEEVYAACEILQALGLRRFAPSITACPGCGRTSSTTFQQLAEEVQAFVRERLPQWRTDREGVENMTLAVMGCVVNGPGESRHATIGISLPGTGETPQCPVYIDGEKVTSLSGNVDTLAGDFKALIEEYVQTKLPPRV